MFLNEARLAATLHHPNIAQVYDIGVEDGDYFFAMEYVHGEDLGRLDATARRAMACRSRSMPRSRSSRACAPGLHYAHEKTGPDGKPLQIVHRDVSPSNVLVSYDGAVKLVDFGIARGARRKPTTHGGLKGKIAYMSPEQCRAQGRARPPQRHVLDRHDPLRADDRARAVHRRDRVRRARTRSSTRCAAADRRSCRAIRAALEQIVMRALARDPDERYATALELQGDARGLRARESPAGLAARARAPDGRRCSRRGSKSGSTRARRARSSSSSTSCAR